MSENLEAIKLLLNNLNNLRTAGEQLSYLRWLRTQE